jgi:excisionase family DNA binding protein
MNGFSVKVVAFKTGAAERTVRGWLASRKLGCIKIGGRVRIPRDELERFIAAGARPAIPDFKTLASGERAAQD